MNEPLLEKFRQFKVFVRKLKKATAKKETGAAQRLRRNKPKYKLDHIVKERYPTFIDALRDLDDCLSLCALFTTLPKTRKTHVEQIDLCQRLMNEFMMYIIMSNSLRKVFISIKGIYYQVEIEGQTITWITPHKLAYQHPTDVDYRIMSSFVEFYTMLLGFVNYRLFMKLGIVYPPTIHSLNQILVRQSEDDCSVLPDTFPPTEMSDAEIQEKRQAEIELARQLQTLFAGLKFFLSREVPRETATFIIRSCGGLVSWDKSIDSGSTYGESDQTITHQIVDRPNVNKLFISRYYIQPQWIFDCINARRLLPVDDYLSDVILPPHLSPFVEETEGDYVPPEKLRLMGIDVPTVPSTGEGQDEGEVEGGESEEDDIDDDDNDEDDNEEEDMDSQEEEEKSEEEEEEKEVKKGKHGADKNKNKKKVDDKPSTRHKIVSGKVDRVDVGKIKKKEKDEEKKLNEMMIAKKNRRLYKKITHLNKRKAQEARVLSEKREKFEKTKKAKKRPKLSSV